jgi:hypothetical protein
MGRLSARRLILLPLFLVLSACGEESGRETVRVNMGAGVAEFLKNSPVKFNSDCSVLLKLCFHKFRLPFSSEQLPDVLISGAGLDLIIHQIQGILIYDDSTTAGKLEAVDITLRGVPGRSDVKLAKNFAYGVVKNILEAGWVRYIFPDEPRVSGKESKKLSDCERFLGHYVLVHPCFDPAYEMSEEQWAAMSSFYNWYFYKDGYYLKFTAWRSRDEKYLPGQASYLFTIEIKSEQEFWLLHFKGGDRTRWKQLLPELLDVYTSRRETIENEAEHAGIEIDRTYQDPPISALGK